MSTPKAYKMRDEMPDSCVADGPLICDPVPGPQATFSPSKLSGCDLIELQVEMPSVPLSAAGFHVVRVSLRAGGRTEWPDAEFCAA